MAETNKHDVEIAKKQEQTKRLRIVAVGSTAMFVAFHDELVQLAAWYMGGGITFSNDPEPPRLVIHIEEDAEHG